MTANDSVAAPAYVQPSEVYTLACPDIIETMFASWPDLDRFAQIGPDGCVELGELGRIPVEGDTTFEAAQRIAARARLPLSQVRVRVVEFNSRQVFLLGQVPGSARAVSYRGPETVVDLLRRTGGITEDAAPNEIYVVRSQVSEAKPAEVLTIDLEAIRERNDQRSNHRVQPQDEIYIGAKPGSKLASAVPPIFKPVYQTIRALLTGWH